MGFESPGKLYTVLWRWEELMIDQRIPGIKRILRRNAAFANATNLVHPRRQIWVFFLLTVLPSSIVTFEGALMTML